ncbi:MAG: hypothetical protein LC776_18170 [Acidobacteria bacterium]|nr:hypothetical protein [Acidobacteriota bacterium]
MIKYSRIAKRPVLVPAVFIVSAAMTFASLVWAKRFGDWGIPVNAESIPGTSAFGEKKFRLLLWVSSAFLALLAGGKSRELKTQSRFRQFILASCGSFPTPFTP